MSWVGKLAQARAELAERGADPWRKTLEDAVGGVEAISSAALLDLLRVPATTGTARRLAKVMRSIGFIPIKSRRLMPGGFRDTVTRGWARPFRERMVGEEGAVGLSGHVKRFQGFQPGQQGRDKVGLVRLPVSRAF
jgi:hypothetical protein